VIRFIQSVQTYARDASVRLKFTATITSSPSAHIIELPTTTTASVSHSPSINCNTSPPAIGRLQRAEVEISGWRSAYTRSLEQLILLQPLIGSAEVVHEWDILWVQLLKIVNTLEERLPTYLTLTSDRDLAMTVVRLVRETLLRASS
jgi:hypothetical protein